MKYLKQFKISNYALAAIAIIAMAAILRIILAASGWPQTNADEDTYGLMGIHINRGEHPFFLVGQNYLGSLEAHIGAVMYHIFGPTIFALRFGMIFLTVLFFISMYLLTSLLYTKKFALFILILFSLGSSTMLTRQLVATGGSAETLLFGSLAFLLACWLALSYNRKASPRLQGLRLLGYSVWGLVVGLGIWSDWLILPFIGFSVLLLIVFCWRDLLSFAPICLLLSLVLGMFPLIDFNLHAAPSQNSLTVLLGLFHGTNVQATHTLPQYIHGLKSTLTVSLPIAVGNPFCPVWELPFLGPNSPHTFQCTLAHGSWALSYIVLWISAALLSLIGLWKLHTSLWIRVKASGAMGEVGKEERQAVILHTTRLFLLCAAGSALLLYSLGAAPLSWPGIHARYLIGLLIALPTVIWPLWLVARAGKWPSLRREQVRIVFGRGALLLIAICFLIGMVSTFFEIPTNQAIDQQQEALISHLMSMGARHIYTDYWTCNRVIFQSDEQIICGVLGNHLEPTHNRYSVYFNLVKADPHAAYVFPSGTPPVGALEQKIALSGQHFQHSTFEGYEIYIYQRQ